MTIISAAAGRALHDAGVTIDQYEAAWRRPEIRLRAAADLLGNTAFNAAVAALLREAADRIDNEMETDSPECSSCADGGYGGCGGNHGEVTYHAYGPCEGDLMWGGVLIPAGADIGVAERCSCFDGVLAVAEAVLG